MSEVVSKKLKFKGDKPKKKKRSHREAEDDGADDIATLAAGDPRGWVFPEHVMEVNGPSFIILPTEPLTCLAWHPSAQRVYAAPLDLPEVPEGAPELSRSEILQTIEPTDVNHVWVISRLSGSEEVVSLRTSSGTFLSAHPSGSLSAITPSRGPLESLTPSIMTSSSFPHFTLRTNSEKLLSAAAPAGPSSGKSKVDIRGDAEEETEDSRLYVKCQREFVLKARIALADARGGEWSSKRRIGDNGPAAGSLEDELRRTKEAQTWGGGRLVTSHQSRKELSKALKEGGLAEAMLDRRAKLKSDRYTK